MVYCCEINCEYKEMKSKKQSLTTWWRSLPCTSRKVNNLKKSDRGAVNRRFWPYFKRALKHLRSKMCSSRCSGKEFYSGLENRISLKRTWWRVAGGLYEQVQAFSSSSLYLLDKKRCPTCTQGCKWIPIRSRGGGGIAILLGASCNTNQVKLFPFGSSLLLSA